MLVLVIDIQSDIVEGSVVDFPAKNTPKNPAPQTLPQVVYSTSVRIPRKAHTNGDYITKMMLRAVEDLSLHVVKETHGILKQPITAIHYILSSPWIISRSKTVKVEFKKDTEITEAIVRNVIEEDRKVLISKYEADMIFIEQKVFDVELNGYAVENYAGKMARTLKVSFAFTLSSDHLVKKIQAAISKHLHIKHEYYHSAILLQYLSSRSRATEREEYVVLHVHGEITDVVVVKNGFSAYLGSFPFGVGTVTRKVSASLRSSFETTASTLSMYVEHKTSETQRTKIENVLLPIMKGWQSECVKSLSGIGENVMVPRAVHLYMESPLAPLFKKALEDVQYNVRMHDGVLRDIHSFALKDVI